MARTRVRWARVAALAAALLAVLSLGGRALGGSGNAEQRTRPRITVGPGQTLWEIARTRIGPEGDPRPYIQEIRELNGLETSELAVGQRLVLPVAGD